MICPNCSNIIAGDSKFCVKCGLEIQSKFTTKDKIITIGRDPENIIEINDQHVSSYHAVLKMIGNTLVLEDLNSTNGTYVNGKKIIISNISKGDRITFGESAEFDWDDFYRLPAHERIDDSIDRDSLRYDNKHIVRQSESEIHSDSILPVRISSDKSIQSTGRKKELISKEKRVKENKNIKVQQNVHAGLGGELSYAMHMNKSWVGQAFLTLALYLFLFWIVGFIANIVFISSANRTKEVIGQNPPGYGCLISLLIIFGILPLIAVLLILAFGISIFSSF